MPVTPKEMSVDAKLRHHIFGEIDRSDAAANVGPILHHPSRDIIIESVLVEVTEGHVTANGTYVVGNGTDVDYFATGTIPHASDAVGDMTAATIHRRRAAANTKVWANHTQSANAGKAKVHVWYYFDATKSDVESPSGAND